MTGNEPSVRKRKMVASVLVDCADCGEPFEITAQCFDLAQEVDSAPSFRCDGCYRDTDNEQQEARNDD